MQQPIVAQSTSPVSRAPVVELDPALWAQVAGGSSAPSGTAVIADADPTATSALRLGPNGGWKHALGGPNGGW